MKTVVLRNVGRHFSTTQLDVPADLIVVSAITSNITLNKVYFRTLKDILLAEGQFPLKDFVEWNPLVLVFFIIII
jgi:hypothetical protein